MSTTRHFSIQMTIDHDPDTPTPYAATYSILEDLPAEGDQELLHNSLNLSCFARTPEECCEQVLEAARDSIAEQYSQPEEEEKTP